LNIYKNALENIIGKKRNIDKLPSLETLRGIMFAALIGNKRHNLYDEVMAAYHSMPDPVTGKVFAYTFRNSYGDLFSSNDENIRLPAREAIKKTLEDIDRTDNDRTVLSFLKRRVFVGKDKEYKKLLELVKDYVKPNKDEGIEIHTISIEIIKYVDFHLKAYEPKKYLI
jgi:hypothetical protein